MQKGVMQKRPRILDLFCGAGGAAMGYYRAGFDVIGVDINPQPHYPFEFHQGDALEYCTEHGQEFDAIHASPPCQPYSTLAHLSNGKHKALIPIVRTLFESSGKPFVIENVPGAPLDNPIMLCGSSFGLKTPDGHQLRRHRLFEISFEILLVPPCQHSKNTIGIFGNKARDTKLEKRHYSKPKSIRQNPTNIKISLHDAGLAMDIDWMNFKELSQSIPPAYTEFIGKQLMKMIRPE